MGENLRISIKELYPNLYVGKWKEGLTTVLDKNVLISPIDFDFPGIYVVYHTGRPYYIGQSANIRKRIKTHYYVLKLGPLVFKAKEIREENMDGMSNRAIREQFEYKLISRLNPPGNVAGTIRHDEKRPLLLQIRKSNNLDVIEENLMKLRDGIDFMLENL